MQLTHKIALNPTVPQKEYFQKAAAEKSIRLPKIGWVKMTEALRFEGKILGATVSRTADRWFVAIQVEVPDAKAKKQRLSDQVIGMVSIFVYIFNSRWL